MTFKKDLFTYSGEKLKIPLKSAFCSHFFPTLMSDSTLNGDLWFSRFIVGAQKYPLKPFLLFSLRAVCNEHKLEK